MKDKKELKEGQNAALLSMLVSFILAVLKATVGFYSGAVVLVTDALDSAADVITSFAAYFGLKLSSKKPTEKFPYGFYKAENLASLVISGFIIYAAVRLLIEGYQRLFILPQLSYPIITLATAIVSGIVAMIISTYLKNTGKKINSESLIANSKDRLKDVFVAIIIFAALLCTYYKIPYVEGIITIIISLLILKIGLETVKDAVFALMDVSPSKEIEKKTGRILDSIPGVESYAGLKLRKAGPYIFGEVKIKIRKFVKVEKAHEIADQIENKIKKKVSQIEAFTIHVEPFKAEKQKIAIPVKENNGLKSKVMPQLARANYFLFMTVNKKKILKHNIKKNPYKGKKVRAGVAVTNFLLKEKIDVLVTKEVGKIMFHTLRDNLVDVFKTEGKTAKETGERFIAGKLKRLTKPTKVKI
ncbi:cation diffusion facilitator family transporter [Candidatus Woesearchaeota archaeon]|nr:cation diffusion facilitator family transporter [Candidatus Woesearchaeota archaeon]MBW3006309.1 cation diffusion facilitator family transporter [Candidatus Woesearchaeota archaeon]